MSEERDLTEPFAFARAKMSELFSRLLLEEDRVEVKGILRELLFVVDFLMPARRAAHFAYKIMPGRFRITAEGLVPDEPGVAGTRGFAALEWLAQELTYPDRALFSFKDRNGMVVNVTLPMDRGCALREALQALERKAS